MLEDYEDFQIVQGAKLADKEPLEQTDINRASRFVSQVLKEKSTHRRIRFSPFTVVSIAAAAALVLWIVTLSPRKGFGDGSPAILQENHSVHAQSATTDSVANELDTLELPVESIIK